MLSKTWVAAVILVFCASPAVSNFCYKENEGCGPSTWGGQCQTGKRQSPINLPLGSSRPSSTIKLNLENYKANSFRLQNNGHTINVDFVDQGGPSSAPRAFPDSIDSSIVRDYIFSGAHFHWGPSVSNGSEHCIQNMCGQMELHLVHFESKYSSIEDAIKSGDENSVAVLGVMIQEPGINSVLNRTGAVVTYALAPIVINLHHVQKPDHHSFVVVDKPLDFTSLLKDADVDKFPPLVYTYKGSLTTPGCNEQVNWYVLRSPALIFYKDFGKFRGIPLTEEGEHLEDYHRHFSTSTGERLSFPLCKPFLT